VAVYMVGAFGSAVEAYTVKVTRRGRITIPKAVREALGIREGDLVQVRLDVERGCIIVAKLGVPEPGKPVGYEEYRRLIEELEGERARWR